MKTLVKSLFVIPAMMIGMAAFAQSDLGSPGSSPTQTNPTNPTMNPPSTPPPVNNTQPGQTPFGQQPADQNQFPQPGDQTNPQQQPGVINSQKHTNDLIVTPGDTTIKDTSNPSEDHSGDQNNGVISTPPAQDQQSPDQQQPVDTSSQGYQMAPATTPPSEDSLSGASDR